METKELTEPDRECLLAYARCGMRASEAARKLIFHRNTVQYHLEQVREKTGLNPFDFYDLVKLVQMCQKEGEGR